MLLENNRISSKEAFLTDIDAVTCCPSGVAHTFMTTRALGKAGAAASLKIKVETQGENGIQNRITDLNVANANVIECSTKEAMRNAATLIEA
ncbi:hypothetical protein AK966_10165 [Vibrio sp. PID23_8]|jgi:fructose-specific PTS system IIC-like component|nr:hypothetical protein AK965_10465 [Vibrio sp. PID17_43]RIZ54064.1 hypothetical protein AK966_10165 [Vibrio sp. PID23_8]